MFKLIVDGIEITKEGYTTNGVSNGYNFIMSGKDDEERHILKWSRWPITFIQEVMGLNEANGHRMADEHKQLMLYVGDLVFAKKMVWDNRLDLSKVNRQTREFAKKLGISVRTGKACGKSSTATQLVIWFLMTNARAKIPIVGPTESALKTVLWSEMHKWVNKRDKDGKRLFQEPFASSIKMDSEKIYMNSPDIGATGIGWSAFLKVAARNADPTVTSGILSGIHEDAVMVVADEAAVIPKEVFAPLVDTLTSRCNFVLLMFNPSRLEGYAFDTHMDPKTSQLYHQLHWDSERMPSWLVSRDHIERMEIMAGGRNTNMFQCFVNGNFPTSNDGSLISWEWVQRAVDKPVAINKDEPIVMGCDIGSTGSDPTVVCIRQGQKVHLFEKITKSDTIDQSGDILNLAKKWKVDHINIDSIGVGAGVYDTVRRYFQNTSGIVASERPNNPNSFFRKRDELWWKARKRFELGLISIPDNDSFIKELTTAQYNDSMQKIKVEDKKSMRQRLGTSTDYADAFCLTLAFDNLDSQDEMLFKPVESMFTRNRNKMAGNSRGSQWVN